MATLERTYNVPLRKQAQKAPKYRRSQKSMIALKEFMMRHMKTDIVKISNFVSIEIFKHGKKNPPHHIKVKAIKNDDGVVHVELEQGEQFFKKVEKIKKESKKDAKKVQDAKFKELTPATEQDKKKEEKILEQKEKTKELAKEAPTTKARKVKGKEHFVGKEEEQKSREEMVISKKNKDDPTFH